MPLCSFWTSIVTFFVWNRRTLQKWVWWFVITTTKSWAVMFAYLLESLNTQMPWLIASDAYLNPALFYEDLAPTKVRTSQMDMWKRFSCNHLSSWLQRIEMSVNKDSEGIFFLPCLAILHESTCVLSYWVLYMTIYQLWSSTNHNPGSIWPQMDSGWSSMCANTALPIVQYYSSGLWTLISPPALGFKENSSFSNGSCSPALRNPTRNFPYGSINLIAYILWEHETCHGICRNCWHHRFEQHFFPEGGVASLFPAFNLPVYPFFDVVESCFFGSLQIIGKPNSCFPPSFFSRR